MKSRKVTDLEGFALSEIYRPYQSMLLGEINVLNKLGGELRLDNAVQNLESNPDWANKVLNRLAECKFYFPVYIKHPLVDYLCEKIERT